MEYIDAAGNLVGFDIDLFTAIADRAGFEVEFVPVAWDGIFAGLIAGQYDVIVSSVTILPERRRQMHFSRPYFVAAQYLLVPADDTITQDISDLVGGEVGAEIGTTGAEFVRSQPGVTLRAYDDLGLALQDVTAGRIAGVVADSAIVAHYVFQSEGYAGRLRIAGDAYTSEAYGFAIRRDRPDLRDAIDDALAEIIADGTWQRLHRKWLPALPDRERPVVPETR